MQSAVVMFARKPPPCLASQPMRRTRRSLLEGLRDDITIMRTIGFNHATIGKTLRITEEDARALSPKINTSLPAARLTRHSIRALVKGRHARIGGRTVPTRAKNLLKIASAYSWSELLEEPGIGVATAMEIQLWLEERGARLRSPIEP